MDNINQTEEQFEPITDYKNINKDEIIEAYSKSQDINKKTTIRYESKSISKEAYPRMQDCSS